MGLLRLVNAARLAPLEELLADARGGLTGGSGGGRPTQRTTVQSAAPPSFPSRTVAASSVSSFAAPAPVSMEPKTVATPGALSLGAAATAAAPAMKPLDAVAAPSRGTKTETAAIGISAEQVTEIKAALQAQQKFVAEVLEHAARWELEGSELRICFRPDKSTFAGLMEGRETLEKIRGVSSKVLGRALRVCARLESGGAKEENSSPPASNGGMSTQELRAQFENDPMVKSMLQRFGGRISEVKRQTEE